MRLEKRGHACVRLERDGATLVVDPGVLTELEAVSGATAVLVTHEHADHLDEDRLRAAAEANPELEIWTNQAVAERMGGLGIPVHAVAEGDTFTAAGFDVRVYGRDHAVIDAYTPVVSNVGFLVGGEVFHPGDAFTVPDVPVPTLLVPATAPWLKASEVADYVRQVAPQRAYPVHDGIVNEYGLALVDGLLKRLADNLGVDCRRLAPGDAVEVG
jgi:L-ascorbate metabolism protein UlaG (beta-lactamase superfamily)